MSATPPPDGFYWLVRQGERPEVVEVTDRNIYHCGSDVRVRLEAWPDRHEFYIIEGECVLVWIEPPKEAQTQTDADTSRAALVAAMAAGYVDVSSVTDYGERDPRRFDVFMAELKKLCRNHSVQISTSGYDALQVWPLTDHDDPIYSAGVDDMISPGASPA